MKTITKQKLTKYLEITTKALDIIKKSIVKGKEEDAREIISMASNYLSDAVYFQSKGDFINAFAAINYAHGWIDCGVRLKIFKTANDRLFTIG